MPGIEDLKRIAKIEFADMVKSVQKILKNATDELMCHDNHGQLIIKNLPAGRS